MSETSDREDNVDPEKIKVSVGEKSKSEAELTGILSSVGGDVEFKPDHTVPATAVRCDEDVETVRLRGSATPSQLFSDQGIFSGTQNRHAKMAGPLITELVMEEGNLQLYNCNTFLSTDYVYRTCAS